ncbi:uncharacterized protein FOMMEDRAFT_26967 [Fomitiporia mediterranea MF3/22]|uniref:uncharacterized protein n=1 Tax=Fomitiporia mediterranea (strain MF3/22) TaxID=694068 RepID=UPI0004407802|nr:uncharacterized protein FOMMEDRAFT_26967 [Fomitiporia mediterranea MF3/22]EJD06248.1 hypothetical protein FOMMEDRAFT_26967 [Fomitiporia mediterranea MF3/22]
MSNSQHPKKHHGNTSSTGGHSGPRSRQDSTTSKSISDLPGKANEEEVKELTKLAKEFSGICTESDNIDARIQRLEEEGDRNIAEYQKLCDSIEPLIGPINNLTLEKIEKLATDATVEKARKVRKVEAGFANLNSRNRELDCEMNKLKKCWIEIQERINKFEQQLNKLRQNMYRDSTQ